jgi:hypothetical protein
VARTRLAERQRRAQHEQTIAAFNEANPPGALVRFWTGFREGPGKEGRIYHVATLLGGHTPVAWIEGAGSCVALTHVEAIDPKGVE